MNERRLERILVIRRDNIGDLACTTPLIAGLRARYPEAFLAALVNSYNAPVLSGNPDLDAVYAYTKAKHRESRQGLISTWLESARLFRALRRIGFDCAVLAAPGFQKHALRLARLAGVRQVLGFVSHAGEGRIEIPIPYGAPNALHEVEDVWRLGAALGVDGSPPPMKIVVDASRVQRLEATVAAIKSGPSVPVVALHISARKPSQRWPLERFAELAQQLHQRHGAAFMLLWSPGTSSNPRHPGDDEKAAALVELMKGLPAFACPTPQLAELIAALAVCDRVVCSDGGALHLAAALGKPIVCLFGDSSASRWHPWKVEYELLQSESRDVSDLGVEQVAAAFGRLSSR